MFFDEYCFEKVVWRLWSGFGIFLGLHFPDFYWLNWFLNPLLLYVRFQSRTRGQSLSSTVVVEVDILTGWSWSYHNVLKLLKRSHLNFSILTFSTIFLLLKVTCLVTRFDRKLQVLKNWSKWTIFDIFHELLSTQNVNVACFARNIGCDFLGDFQILWIMCNALRKNDRGISHVIRPLFVFPVVSLKKPSCRYAV